MITAQNIIHHEFIGLDVFVIASSNPSLTSISGRIIDETKQMFVIQPYIDAKKSSQMSDMQSSQMKKVAKKGSVFRCVLPDGRLVDVDGDAICTAPHRRIGMKEVRPGFSCGGL
jgi:ribonuclease P protein subunit POP4